MRFKLNTYSVGREGVEPSRQMSSHFECDASTNFAIYPIIITTESLLKPLEAFKSLLKPLKAS